MDEIVNIEKSKIEVEKKKEGFLRVLDQMNTCDSVLHAVLAVVSKKGYKTYRSWWNKKKNQMNRLLSKDKKQITIWDRMKRKSNKII